MTRTWRTADLVSLLIVSLALGACPDDDGSTSAPDEPPIDGDPATP